VNLFAALNFSQAFGSETFGVHKIESCLKEEDPQKFEFRADRFRWRDTELSVEEIETARRFHSGSFGSCSVDEPDESLTAISSQVRENLMRLATLKPREATNRDGDLAIVSADGKRSRLRPIPPIFSL
jgi:hypothetical protein